MGGKSLSGVFISLSNLIGADRWVKKLLGEGLMAAGSPASHRAVQLTDRWFRAMSVHSLTKSPSETPCHLKF